MYSHNRKSLMSFYSNKSLGSSLIDTSECWWSALSEHRPCRQWRRWPRLSSSRGQGGVCGSRPQPSTKSMLSLHRGSNLATVIQFTTFRATPYLWPSRPLPMAVLSSSSPGRRSLGSRPGHLACKPYLSVCRPNPAFSAMMRPRPWRGVPRFFAHLRVFFRNLQGGAFIIRTNPKSRPALHGFTGHCQASGRKVAVCPLKYRGKWDGRMGKCGTLRNRPLVLWAIPRN